MKVAAWITLTGFTGGRMRPPPQRQPGQHGGESVPSRVSPMGSDLSGGRKPLASPAKGMEWTFPAATEKETE